MNYYSKVEYKVRPLERYNLTRYEENYDIRTDKPIGASCNTIGVFDTEATANFVKDSLESTVEQKWVIVEDSFETNGIIYYSYTKQDAEEMRKKLEIEHNKAFTVFSR